MRRLIRWLLPFAVFAWPALAVAQQAGTPVYLTPNSAVAATPWVTGTASDSGTINKQLTVTIQPPAGQYVYVTGWDWSACQDATASAALSNGTFTTTGFVNLPKIGQVSLGITNSICSNPVVMSMGAWPIKSKTPGTAVTFVSPAQTADLAFTLNVYAFFAP